MRANGDRGSAAQGPSTGTPRRNLQIGLFLAAQLGGCAAGPTSSAPSDSAVAVAPGNEAEAKCLALAATPRERAKGAPDTIRVSHILIKHEGAKNPVATATRTRGQACLRALEARDKILAGADFEQIVASTSDEPGAASRAGSIGDVTPKDVVPAFADAAFGLSIQQMSDVVETEFGFHLILRTQ